MNVNRDSLPIYLYSTTYHTLCDESTRANPFTINAIAKIDAYLFKNAVKYGKIKCRKGRTIRLMEKMTIEESSISTSKYKEERICIGE